MVFNGEKKPLQTGVHKVCLTPVLSRQLWDKKGHIINWITEAQPLPHLLKTFQNLFIIPTFFNVLRAEFCIKNVLSVNISHATHRNTQPGCIFYAGSVQSLSIVVPAISDVL